MPPARALAAAGNRGRGTPGYPTCAVEGCSLMATTTAYASCLMSERYFKEMPKIWVIFRQVTWPVPPSLAPHHVIRKIISSF